MEKKRLAQFILIIAVLSIFVSLPMAFAISDAYKGNIYQPGALKPMDSKLKVKVGDPAPNFTLPAISGEKISLGRYRGKNNIVLSFVPAAWTPVHARFNRTDNSESEKKNNQEIFSVL